MRMLLLPLVVSGLIAAVPSETLAESFYATGAAKSQYVSSGGVVFSPDPVVQTAFGMNYKENKLTAEISSNFSTKANQIDEIDANIFFEGLSDFSRLYLGIFGFPNTEIPVMGEFGLSLFQHGKIVNPFAYIAGAFGEKRTPGALAIAGLEKKFKIGENSAASVAATIAAGSDYNPGIRGLLYERLKAALEIRAGRDFSVNLSAIMQFGLNKIKGVGDESIWAAGVRYAPKD